MAAEVSEEEKNFKGVLRLPHPRLAENSFSTADGEIRALVDNGLYEACGTRVAFTYRFGGVSQAPYESLNLKYELGDLDSNVEANRRRLIEALAPSASYDSLIAPNQVHGCEVISVGAVNESKKRAENGADGVLCDKRGIPVLLCFADCVSVILVAPGGAFAVLHSGWRGTISSIARVGLDKLVKATSCLPSEVNCYIGPHIGSCCYEVGSDLIQDFVREFGEGCDAGNDHLDLSFAVSESLRRGGADPSRIVDAGMCTSCRNDLFYSYRAESGVTGRHGAFAYREEGRWD